MRFLALLTAFASCSPRSMYLVVISLGVFNVLSMHSRDSSNDFNRLIKSPIISRNDQQVVINTILKKISASDTVIKFFSVICNNRRSFIIDRICIRFLELEVKYKGEVRAELLSTTNPAEDDLKKIEQIIKKAMGTNVSLISKVDPTIIGGYILNIGSVMLDGSVRSKLQGLKVSMKGIK